MGESKLNNYIKLEQSTKPHLPVINLDIMQRLTWLMSPAASLIPQIINYLGVAWE